MAEDDETADAAERLEQALRRIAAATGERVKQTQHAQAKVATVAERLDLVIAELRAALAHGSDPSGAPRIESTQ